MSGSDKSESRLDSFLRYGEGVIVLLITMVAIAAAVNQVIWIALCDQATRQGRLSESLELMSENWKAGLLILAPLFYRTIRAFLERVTEFAGMKASPTPQIPSFTAVKPNPIPAPPGPEQLDS